MSSNHHPCKPLSPCSLEMGRTHPHQVLPLHHYHPSHPQHYHWHRDHYCQHPNHHPSPNHHYQHLDQHRNHQASLSHHQNLSPQPHSLHLRMHLVRHATAGQQP